MIESFVNRFFGGETRGQMLGRIFALARVGDFCRIEHAIQEMIAVTLDRALNAGDFDEIDADVGLHNNVFVGAGPVPALFF